MSNSPLVDYTLISPNSSPRYRAIDKITVHHMAGILSVETCGNVFQSPAREASSNYGIGSDGRIGLYVPEDRRAWTSSSQANDQRAVTIEASNCAIGGDWPVSDVVWNKLVELCADICRRNGIPALHWTGDANGNLTVHRFFAATTCPGDYLYARMGQLADEVNAAIGGSWTPAVPSGDIDELARAVIRGEYGNGDARRAALGSNYDAVQARVNEILGGGAASAPAPAAPSQSRIDELAQAVIRGDYGNGEERRQRLGSDYDAVQARVNQLLTGNGGGNGVSSDIDELARAVIRGEYGNGDARRAALGSKYDAVQRRVNQLLS